MKLTPEQAKRDGQYFGAISELARQGNYGERYRELVKAWRAWEKTVFPTDPVTGEVDLQGRLVWAREEIRTLRGCVLRAYEVVRVVGQMPRRTLIPSFVTVERVERGACTGQWDDVPFAVFELIGEEAR